LDYPLVSINVYYWGYWRVFVPNTESNLRQIHVLNIVLITDLLWDLTRYAF